MFLLSKCKTVIKSSSALSAFSKIINPSLDLYTINAARCRWFPAAMVKPYVSKTDKINKILSRTMKNHQYPQ